MSFPKYSDRYGNYDHDGCPSERPGELCLNCHRDWCHHSGWACNFDVLKRKPQTSWSNTVLENRYTTPSMLNSTAQAQAPAQAIHFYITSEGLITKSLPAVEKPKDKPDWKFFRNSTPGECPCGSTPGVCPDHR